jgi:hypothetical protein
MQTCLIRYHDMLPLLHELVSARVSGSRKDDCLSRTCVVRVDTSAHGKEERGGDNGGSQADVVTQGTPLMALVRRVSAHVSDGKEFGQSLSQRHAKG